VSSLPTKDQDTAIGTKHTHPNGDTTVVMPLDEGAKVPWRCAEHKRQAALTLVEARQEGLFD
jgi:hypothetical protein